VRQRRAPHRCDQPGLVVYRKTEGIDAIDEYSRRLVDALCDRGVKARYVGDGLSLARRRVPCPRWILIQYNPFAYGHWGVAPELVAEALMFRHRTGAPLAVSVHESWVNPDDRGRTPWRSLLMGGYQRLQLASLLGAADVVMAATQALVRQLGHDAIHVPVGSNVIPIPVNRDDARDRLGIHDELVVALFGTGHPSRALEYATAAIERLVDARGSEYVKVLNLGVGAPAIDLRGRVAVETPGELVDRELSLRLSASDLLLLPFTDGLSTRRTTMMAGLAHGLPVVGLQGPGTDDVLVRSGQALTLTPLGDIAAFAKATVALAEDADRRRATGRAGRELYATQFDWSVTARRVAAALANE
jgi:glycosyltransferase involved in cell wall biosynthesis